MGCRVGSRRGSRRGTEGGTHQGEPLRGTNEGWGCGQGWEVVTNGPRLGLVLGLGLGFGSGLGLGEPPRSFGGRAGAKIAWQGMVTRAGSTVMKKFRVSG